MKERKGGYSDVLDINMHTIDGMKIVEGSIHAIPTKNMRVN